MFIAYIILAILFSAMIVMSGVSKLQPGSMAAKGLTEVVKVPVRALPWLAACEFAGAAGLLIGIIWSPLGIAAASGLVIYFIGAIVAHIRVRDFKSLTAPAIMLLVSLVVLITRILSLPAHLL